MTTKHILSIIYAIVLIIALSFNAFSANWYVDKNASGANNGTSWTNAWESFADINMTSLDPGDTVFISGGSDSTIYYEQLWIPGTVKGTAANYITIIAGKYSPSPSGHSGRVIIDCQAETRNASIYMGIYDPTPEYIYIKGFEMRGGTSGIKIEDYANCITIDSCRIYDWYGLAGVFTNSQEMLLIDSVTIKNCSIINAVNLGAETDGIYIEGSTNTVIHDNYIRMRSQDPTEHVDCIQSYNARGLVLYNNILISDSVTTGGGMPVIWRNNNTNPVIIYNNFCYMGGMWVNANWDMIFNMHPGDQGQGYGDQSPTYIFNNTLVGSGPQLWGAVLEYFGENYDGVFLNNILTSFGSGSYNGLSWLATLAVSGTVDVDSIRNNIIWREWTTNNPYGLLDGFYTNGSTTIEKPTWAQWTATLGGTGINSNPLFINNFGHEPDQGVLRGTLQSNSPAINAGEDLTYLKNYLQSTYGIIVDIEHDINGLTRNTSSPTIGAYEYEEAGWTPPDTTGTVSFTSVTNANLNSYHIAYGVVSGIDSTSHVWTVTSDSFAVNYPFTLGLTMQEVENGDTIAISNIANGSYSTANINYVVLSGTSRSFTVTTKADPYVPPSGNNSMLRGSDGILIKDSTGKIIKVN